MDTEGRAPVNNVVQRTRRRMNNLLAQPTGNAWFRMHPRNDAALPARVDIYAEIGGGGWMNEGVSAVDFIAQLAVIPGDLEIHLNSPGGDVFDGLAIYNALAQRQGNVTTVIDGLAASAASFIAMAGKTRLACPGSMMMIHDAAGLCMGNSADMRELADLLDKVSDNIAAIYAERSGRPDGWRAAMEKETWYTADEAVEAGLVHRLAQRPEQSALAAAAKFDLSAYLHAPRVGDAQPVPAAVDAYQPQPYERESWENVQCPVCGKYNDSDGVYCGQCGVMLAGRDDVQGAPSQPDDDDGMTAKRTGGVIMNGPEGSTITVDLSHSADPEPFLAMLREALRNAAVDESAWDGPHAMSLAAESEDPAATYKQICAGRREGDPSLQSSWALPYKYPGKPPNAAGVKNALGRLPQTQGLTNADEAKALLQRLMKQINPDYQPEDTAALPAWLTAHHEDDALPLPAWLLPAQEATQ